LVLSTAFLHRARGHTVQERSARAIFRAFPRVKRRLWGGARWEDGYFARTVGDKVTTEVMRRYIQQHRIDKAGDTQLSLFA
jgi:putative transposase